MSRLSIITSAKSGIGSLKSGILKTIRKTISIDFPNSEWSAAYICYVYKKSGHGNDLYFSSTAIDLISNNTSISTIWPNNDGATNLPRKILLDRLNPGDIIVFNFGNTGHCGIIESVTKDSSSSLDSYKLLVVEGDCNNTVKEKLYKYSELNDVYGFILPPLSGIGYYNSNKVLGNTFLVRDINNDNTKLTPSLFNQESGVENPYKLSYYMHDKNIKWLTPGLNSCSTLEKSVLPNMVAYCQGRAREVWDHAFPFVCGLNTPSKDIENEFPFYYCYTNNIMYLLIKEENQTSGETDRHWEPLYAVSANDINSIVSQYKSKATPFLDYGGLNLLGTPKLMFLNAVAAGMKVKTLYKTKTNGDYSSFLTIKDTTCVPTVGAIIVWSDGSPTSNYRPGYCGFIEKVKDTGEIFVSCSGINNMFFNSFWLFPLSFCNGYLNYLVDNSSADNFNRINNNGIYLLGYIYPPESALIVYKKYYFILTVSSNLSLIERIWVV